MGGFGFVFRRFTTFYVYESGERRKDKTHYRKRCVVLIKFTLLEN